ncbi:MAG: undecaprenyl-diphosphate phosphatase [Clostridiales bacterium]|nr:undecaprenyl-diphosphate phosphatase [Clostridiales bacterium]
MTIIEAVIQGIIQGLTEFLPISSSGHLSIYQHFTGNSGDAGFLMLSVLHLGTLVAVFIAFWDTIWALIKEFIVMIKDIFTGKFKWKTMNGERRMIIMLVISLSMLAPFYIFKDFFVGISTDDDIIVEGICFLYTSVILFLSDRCVKGKREPKDITVKNAVTVGVFQGFALMPGISRSGSTISGGLFSGFTKETAVKFSFILGIPAILGGCLLEVKDAFDTGQTDIELLPFIVGFIVSAVVGIFAIKLVRWLIKSDKFKIFAFYTLVLGIAVISIGIIERVLGKAITEIM